jgi:N-acetylmuramoyl-L-alanine amidase
MESPAVFFNKYDFIIKNGTVFMNAELICSILDLTFISKNDCVYINRSLKKIQGIHVFFQKNLIRIIYDLNRQPELDFYKISNDTYLVKFYNTEYPDIFFYKEYDAHMKYIKTVHYSDKEVWSKICTFSEPQVKKSIQDNKVTIDFEFAPREKKVVVIDPGHGGEDPGAIGPGGTYEKDINLQVALKTVELLKNYEIDTIMTRTIDIYTELEKRSAIAEQNDADLFISIHMNSFPQNRQLRGSEIYYYDFTAQNYSNRLLKRENLDEDFQSILLPIIQSKENTIRDSRYYSILLNSWALLKGVCSRGIFPQDFWVLAYAQCPAVLFELDYLSNPEVENCFLDGAYQDTYAEIIAKSIIQYFGLKK